MRWAINIRTENATAEPIRQLWDQVEKFEDAPSVKSLNYPPHFTFAIYSEMAPSNLASTAEKISSGRKPLIINITSIEIFDVSPLVLWLKAEDEAPLFEIRKIIHDRLSDETCHEHYKLGAWQPHCTLGYQIAEEHCTAAKEFAAQPFDPVEVCFDIVDWVKFPPVEILGQVELSS